MLRAMTIIRYELALLFRSIMFYISLLMLSIYSVFAGRTDMEYAGFDVFAVGAAYKSYFFIFLALSFVYISYFFKDQSERFNEIIGSMPYKSIELGFIRWFCAVAAGIMLCIIHVLIELIAFKSFYFGFSLEKLTEWFLIGCVPVVLLSASTAFLSASIFKNQIAALVSTVLIWTSLAIWDSTFFPLNNFPVLHLISPEAKLYETGFSQISGYTKGLNIVFYCVVFCILSSFLMFLSALGIFKKARERSRNLILTGIIALVALCMVFPAVSYHKTYCDIKNNFENKLSALKIYEQEISKNTPGDFTVKSLNLNIRITENGLNASGKVKLANRSDHEVSRIVFNLGENFSIESINDKSGKLNYIRKGFIVEVPLKTIVSPGDEAELDLTYSGSVREWKRAGSTYRDYSAYSFITPDCVYLAQNTGWYPQSPALPPYKHEFKILESRTNKKVDTLVTEEIIRPLGQGGTDPVKGLSPDTFDIDIRFEGLDGKTAISNFGTLKHGIQKYRNTSGMFLYAAKLSMSNSNEMDYYLTPGHDRYIDSLQRDFKSREAFFKAFLPSSSIKSTIVELPFSNSYDIKASADIYGMSFLNEKILYRLDSKNRYLENEISKAYLSKWLPPTKESLDYLNAGKIISYEEALTDYLVYLYNISTGDDMYSTKISSNRGTAIIAQDPYPLASRIDYHISYGKNSGNSTYVDHFENIKLMISKLDNIRKTSETDKFSEALVKLINIIRERPLEEKDILNIT